MSAAINISDQGKLAQDGHCIIYIGEFNYTYNTYVDKDF